LLIFFFVLHSEYNIEWLTYYLDVARGNNRIEEIIIVLYGMTLGAVLKDYSYVWVTYFDARSGFSELGKVSILLDGFSTAPQCPSCRPTSQGSEEVLLRAEIWKDED
jgi:hypothetical protein